MTARSSEASCAGEASNPQLIIAASPIATSHPASGMIGLSAGMHPVAGRWSAPLHALISNDGSITSGSTPGRSMKGLCPSHSFVAMQKSFHDAGNEFLDGLTRLFGIDQPQSTKGKEFATLRARDNWYAFVGAYDYLKEHNLLDQATFTQGEAHGLSMKKMDELLGDEGWQNVIDEYFKLKKEHVEILINAFVEPDKYQTRNGKNLRDEFLDQIEQHHRRFQENHE